MANAAAHGPTVTIGRIVHYVLDEGPNRGQHRPAVVVQVWNDDTVNLQVFTDGANDDEEEAVVWRTSVPFNAEEEFGTWHWPERA